MRFGVVAFFLHHMVVDTLWKLTVSHDQPAPLSSDPIKYHKIFCPMLSKKLDKTPSSLLFFFRYYIHNPYISIKHKVPVAYLP